MATLHEVIGKELKSSFCTGLKRNDYNESRVNELTGRLADMLSTKPVNFRQVWVELFVVYPQQESLHCLRRIFKTLNLRIPADLAQND